MTMVTIMALTGQLTQVWTSGLSFVDRPGYTVVNIGLLVVIALTSCTSVIECQELRRSSQCFNGDGHARLELACPSTHMIKITRSFQGSPNRQGQRATSRTCPDCTFCPGDCTDESVSSAYDWSTCTGNASCQRAVIQSQLSACSSSSGDGAAGGRPSATSSSSSSTGAKQSSYAQVEYQCVPRESTFDICSSTEKVVKSGFVTTPSYPAHYPPRQDCKCTLASVDPSARLTLSINDLLLETKAGRCRADWLMVRQKAQRHRHCGAILTGTKNITVEAGGSIQLQFHSDDNDTATQSFQYLARLLKGFWLHFAAEPASPVRITCRRLFATDPEVEEIKRDDSEYYDDKKVASSSSSSAGGGEGGGGRRGDGDQRQSGSSSAATDGSSPDGASNGNSEYRDLQSGDSRSSGDGDGNKRSELDANGQSLTSSSGASGVLAGASPLALVVILCFTLS